MDFSTGALLELAEVEYELDGADFSQVFLRTVLNVCIF